MKTDVVIDIETLALPVSAKEIEEYMEAYAPPANYKTAEAILRHREKTEKEAVQKLSDDKRFSLGGKRMISCALGLIDMDKQKVVQLESWAGDDLALITKGIVNYLDDVGDYRIIGWNHVGFDLPEVTKAFWKTKTRPMRRAAKWDVIDLCKHPFYRCKLKETAKAFGIEVLGVDGSMVSDLYEKGDWDTIKKYNEDDVRITGELFIAASSMFTF
jgi:hypothetical protein